jgi:hypothetical protein
LKRVSLVTFIQSLEKRGCDRLEVSVSPDRIFSFFLKEFFLIFLLLSEKKKKIFLQLPCLWFVCQLEVIFLNKNVQEL